MQRRHETVLETVWMSVCQTTRSVTARLSFKDDQEEEDQINSAVLLTSCIFNAHCFNI